MKMNEESFICWAQDGYILSLVGGQYRQNKRCKFGELYKNKIMVEKALIFKVGALSYIIGAKKGREVSWNNNVNHKEVVLCFQR